MEDQDIIQYSKPIKLLIATDAVKEELEQLVNHNHKLKFMKDEFGNNVIPYSVQFNSYYQIYMDYFMNMDIITSRIDYLA